jgi:hypothetical protein
VLLMLTVGEHAIFTLMWARLQEGLYSYPLWGLSYALPSRGGGHRALGSLKEIAGLRLANVMTTNLSRAR